MPPFFYLYADCVYHPDGVISLYSGPAIGRRPGGHGLNYHPADARRLCSDADMGLGLAHRTLGPVVWCWDAPAEQPGRCLIIRPKKKTPLGSFFVCA